MLKRQIDILKKQLMKLKEPTRICKICFKEFRPNTFRYLFNKNIELCNSCFTKLKPQFYEYKIDKIQALSLYEYDDTIKSLVYQFKGCYDVELRNIFLSEYLNYIRFRYIGYVIVPIPSSYIDDRKRQFNHVAEIFKALKLPMYKVIVKTDEYKQSEQKAKDRHLIDKHLKLSNIEQIKNKKILLVDDVVTTGSTLRAAIKLIKSAKVKRIEILTVARRIKH